MEETTGRPLSPTEQMLIAAGFTRKESKEKLKDFKEQQNGSAEETDPHEDNVPEYQQCQCMCRCKQRRRYRSNAWLDAETRGRVVSFSAPYEFCKPCMDKYHLDSVRDEPSWDCHPDPAVREVDNPPDAYCQSLSGQFHPRCGLRPRRFNESQESDDEDEEEESPWESNDHYRADNNKDSDALIHESEVLEHE